jgi:hypothetical protein
MPHAAALPFRLRRSEDVVSFAEITSTTEVVHGLLRLEGDRLVVQWRVSRSTDVVGLEIRTDRELGPVREIALPLSALAGAAVRWRWKWPPGRYLVLTAAELRSFEEVTGEAGLRLDHPAEIAIRLRRADRVPASEFVAELSLAIAEWHLGEGDVRTRFAGDAGSRLRLEGE